ncbi:hypothetical protein NC652_016567 [Populus alba x Populus x berolinensis]|nr:hypothetical protein NC652_016567 [Populus alba x Populus x berolinensis]
MAKEVSGSRSWIEVAPAPIIYPRKPSNAPRLEPIAEEGHEEQDEDSQAFHSIAALLSLQLKGHVN